MTPDEINSVIAGTQGWRRTQTTGVVIDGWLVPGGGFAYEPPSQAGVVRGDHSHARAVEMEGVKK
jgi:hypothetical protein